MCRVLVAEISGKRPGDVKSRPTEGFDISYDKVIISNNSEGYDTDWDIVNVPQDYVEWYKENYKTSENAWYAPMNRSYAIKYARERGYKYLVQLDDNIKLLEIAYMIKDGEITKRYQVNSRIRMDDFIEMLCCVLDNTNAAMVGRGLSGTSVPDQSFIKERYVYSLFALNLETCHDTFHGDFEDDIEYRLKLSEMGLPTVMVCPLRYTKTGQRSDKDETGNRSAYTKAGLKRGDNMRKLHGDVYLCGYTFTPNSTSAKKSDVKLFKHRLKPVKIGVLVKDRRAIERCMAALLEEYAVEKADTFKLKELGKHGET